MRNQKDLDVDVHARTQETRRRTHSNNGNLHRVFDAPQVRWYHRIFKWENLIVAGREVKGWVVPQPLGVALIVVVFGAVGWAYKSGTSEQRETRDSIIRMETMLNERTQTFKEQQAEFKENLETEKRIAELQREQQNKEVVAMRIALQEKGIRVAQ